MQTSASQQNSAGNKRSGIMNPPRRFIGVVSAIARDLSEGGVLMVSASLTA
jgi:hypothetical protein